MMVADTKKNTLIEARGYPHGYGKVHEISVSEQFKNIHTFSDLLNAFRMKKPLQRLDRSGTVTDTISSFKILPLAQCCHP
jgi:hypothetical protein